MRTLKVFIGIGCLMASLLPGLLVLGELGWGRFNLPSAFCFLAFVVTGVFLIRQWNSPIPWKARIAIVGVMCFVAGFMVVIVVPNFIKATHQSAANACINNLRQIDAAKDEWALENHKTNGTFVAENDLKPYIKLDSDGNIPRCGIGGKYIIGRVGEDPKCRVGTSAWPNIHILKDTNNYNWQTNFKMAYSRLFGLNSFPSAETTKPDEK